MQTPVNPYIRNFIHRSLYKFLVQLDDQPLKLPEAAVHLSTDLLSLDRFNIEIKTHNSEVVLHVQEPPYKFKVVLVADVSDTKAHSSTSSLVCQLSGFRSPRDVLYCPSTPELLSRTLTLDLEKRKDRLLPITWDELLDRKVCSMVTKFFRDRHSSRESSSWVPCKTRKNAGSKDAKVIQRFKESLLDLGIPSCIVKWESPLLCVSLEGQGFEGMEYGFLFLQKPFIADSDLAAILASYGRRLFIISDQPPHSECLYPIPENVREIYFPPGAQPITSPFYPLDMRILKSLTPQEERKAPVGFLNDDDVSL